MAEHTAWMSGTLRASTSDPPLPHLYSLTTIVGRWPYKATNGLCLPNQGSLSSVAWLTPQQAFNWSLPPSLTSVIYTLQWFVTLAPLPQFPVASSSSAGLLNTEVLRTWGQGTLFSPVIYSPQVKLLSPTVSNTNSIQMSTLGSLVLTSFPEL